MNYEKLIYILQKEKDKLFQYASYRLSNTMDAEDALQDLYIAITSKIRTLTLSDPRPYIYRALSNICSRKLRDAKYYLPIDEVDMIAESENFEEEFRVINFLLSKLPENQSEIIRLHLHSELTFKEISEILKIPEATAKSRFKYGIEHIRKELKKINYFK